MTRKLAVNMRDLIDAFDHSEGIKSYLDVETGAVFEVTQDTLDELEKLPQDEDEMEQALAKFPDWQQEVLREAARIDDGLGTRYLEVPQIDSYEGYEDMEAFIETIDDDHLREVLDVAIRGKGAFRRFKDVLLNYPEQRERWFAFKDEQMRGRALRWLASEAIELVEIPGTRP